MNEEYLRLNGQRRHARDLVHMITRKGSNSKEQIYDIFKRGRVLERKMFEEIMDIRSPITTQMGEDFGWDEREL